MAATIKIKRSTGDGAPSLVAGELAYSAALSANTDQGAGVLYIGNPATGTNIEIGGTKYTSLLTATPGTAAASKAVILDASAGITGLGAVSANTLTANTVSGGNVQISTNTISTTDTNGNLNLNPNGTGKVQIAGTWTLPREAGTNGYVLTSDGAGNTSWQQSSSTLSTAGNSGTGSVNLLTETLNLTGSGGISTTASGNGIAFSLASSLTSLAGLSVANNDLIIGTGANTFATLATGATGRDLLADATPAEAQATLQLVPGTDVQAWSSSLDALAAKTSTGVMVQTGANTYTSRTITGSGDVSVADGSGVDGNPTISVVGNLKGVQDVGTNGIYVKTGANTAAAREVTSLNGNVTVTNGDGVIGNITLDLADNLLGVSSVATNGFYVRTGANTATAREITGTANNIVVTNGDGVASSPTIDLATVTQGTGGTFSKVTIDSYGRVTENTAVVTADITALVDNTYVALAGSTMNANASLTFSGTGTVTGLPNPVNATDAANKSYVDNAVSGLSWKQAVRALANSNITLANTQTIDGVSLQAGDRVLVIGQNTDSEDGIYVVVDGGSWTRATDADPFGELDGAAVFVTQGTVYADTGWVQTATLSGFSGQNWAQFSGAGAYSAGTGLSLDGTIFNFNHGLGLEVGANNTIQVNTNDSNAVQISGSEVVLVLDGGALSQSANGLTISTSGVTNAMLQNSSVILDADTGTGTLALGGTLDVVGTAAQGISTSVANSQIIITAADATDTAKGVASFSNTNFAVASGVVTLKDGGVDLSSNTVTGTLPVSKGGTGQTSFTAGRVLIGDGSSPIATDADLAFDSANNSLTIGTAVVTGGATDVTITATGTDGDINLVPNGTGTVNIGASGAGTIASSSGQTLTVTGDAGLTLAATSNDIIMTVAAGDTAKVTVSGPTATQYATGMDDSDLVNKYFVENVAVIDGGTY